MIKYAPELIILCLAAFIVVPWYYRHQLLEHSLLEVITPGEFQGLYAYLDDEQLHGDFWTISGGLKGLQRRFRRMTVIVRYLQHQVRSGAITPAEARYVWGPAAKQVYFTVVSFPEAAVCALWRDLPHAYGVYALRQHYEVVTRTIYVCSSEDTGPELMRLL